jgi:hypothetical protein
MVSGIGCQSSSSGGGLSGVAAEIGPEGGILTASDGTRFEIPAGALPAAATLTLKPASPIEAPPGATFVSNAWTLDPEWLQFAAPITVTFPIDGSRLDGGPIVLSSAPPTTGYLTPAPEGDLAFAGTVVDSTHVSASTTRFGTGGVATASCPAQCATTVDPVGQTLSCSATCLGHAYSLTCNAPVGSPGSCTCSVDGVVASATRVDTDGGLGEVLYTTACGFPSSSLSMIPTTKGGM